VAFDRVLVLVDPALVDVASCHLLETFDKILVFECSHK